MAAHDELFDMFLGPLDRDYCILFLVFTVISLVTLALGLFTLLGTVLTSKIKNLPMVILGGLWGLSTAAIFYLQNRLLYGMCIRK